VVAPDNTAAPTRSARSRAGQERHALGWREWLSLPQWGVDFVKAKIDTGARSSSLHAFDLRTFERDAQEWVKFEIHPWQRSTADMVTADAPVVGWRDVRSSSGSIDRRPVVRTTLVIAGMFFDADVTLTRRDEMGFRMLIGREAIRRRFVVDPAISYCGGRPPREIRRRNRGIE
jgi:hypothetical protein